MTGTAASPGPACITMRAATVVVRICRRQCADGWACAAHRQDREWLRGSMHSVYARAFLPRPRAAVHRRAIEVVIDQDLATVATTSSVAAARSLARLRPGRLAVAVRPRRPRRAAVVTMVSERGR